MKKLSKAKLKEFKKYFLQQKQNLLSRSKNELVESFGDEVDVAQGIILNSMIEKLSYRDKEALYKINDSLRRIEDGSYGQCEECLELINEKRLSAIPYCTHCIDCAEQEERLSKQYRS